MGTYCEICGTKTPGVYRATCCERKGIVKHFAVPISEIAEQRRKYREKGKFDMTKNTFDNRFERGEHFFYTQEELEEYFYCKRHIESDMEVAEDYAFDVQMLEDAIGECD